jgi:hypothetical protein
LIQAVTFRFTYKYREKYPCQDDIFLPWTRPWMAFNFRAHIKFVKFGYPAELWIRVRRLRPFLYGI